MGYRLFARVLAPLCLAVCGLGHAAELALEGPDVIVFPYQYVPFVSATYTSVRQGIRMRGGACALSLAMSVKPGELGPGQKRFRIQRAFDPVHCRELVEDGIVDRGYSPSGDAPQADPQACCATPAGGDVGYSDGNHPTVATVRGVAGNGVPVAFISMTYDYNPTPDCKVTNGHSIAYNNAATRWTKPYDAGAVYTASCSGASGSHTARMENHTDIPGELSCAGGVAIWFKPFRLTTNYQGIVSVGGTVYWQGDAAQCGTYLYRYQSVF